MYRRVLRNYNVSIKNRIILKRRMDESSEFTLNDAHDADELHFQNLSEDSSICSKSDISSMQSESSDYDISDSSDDYKFEADRDSDFDFFEDEEIEETVSLRSKLIDWAMRNKVTDKSLNELLQILSSLNLDLNLPKDARTLLQKSSKKVKTVSVSGGSYWQQGIPFVLSKIEECNIKLPPLNEITVSVDGVPVSESPSKQFWIILMKIPGIKKPLVLGIYFGKKKPSNLNFLHKFVDDMNVCPSVRLDKFVVDVPAAGLIKGTKGHNGYFCCGGCTNRRQAITP